MKRNKNDSKPRKSRGILIVAILLALGTAAIGVMAAYSKLSELWQEQCVITDMATQVTIAEGKMVRADVIAEGFGLRPGANLAQIDFRERRRQMLDRTPNLRDISIRRFAPNRVSISVEERTPVAKLGLGQNGKQQSDGRVTDDEGMVFVCHRGTQMLPTIREAAAKKTSPGKFLGNRARAALLLLRTCNNPEYSAVNPLEADISKQDYILLTLDNYSQVKIAWDGMDAPDGGVEKLHRRLFNLHSTITSSKGVIATWNAYTDDNVISADIKKGYQ